MKKFKVNGIVRVNDTFDFSVVVESENDKAAMKRVQEMDNCELGVDFDELFAAQEYNIHVEVDEALEEDESRI